MSEVIVIDEGSSGLELFSYGECDGWGYIDGSGHGAGCSSFGCRGDGAAAGGLGWTGRAVGTGSGHDRTSTSTSGACLEYFLHDSSDGVKWMCPIVNDIVYCINKDHVYPRIVEGSVDHLPARFWFTREEAEAALAMRVLSNE
jgi:hypothetical protein